MKKFLLGLALINLVSCKDEIVAPPRAPAEKEAIAYAQDTVRNTEVYYQNKDTIFVSDQRFLKTEFGNQGLYIDSAGTICVVPIEDQWFNCFDEGLFVGDCTVIYKDKGYNPNKRMEAYRVLEL